MSEATSLIHAVHVITQMLSSTLDSDEGLKRTLQVAMETLDTEGGAILRHGPANHSLRFCHVVGGKADDLVGVEISDNEGIAGQVFEWGRPHIDNDVLSNPAHYKGTDDALGFETRSMVTAPIRYPGGKTIGVIQLVNKRSGDFTEDDLTVLDIVACVSAMSAQNADLAEQAEKSAVLHYLGDLAHDIKNKATPIIMAVDTLDYLVKGFDPDAADSAAVEGFRRDMAEIMQILAEHAEDIQRYTAFIAGAAKGDPVEPTMKEGDLGEVASGQVKRLEPEARRSGVTLTCDVDGKVVCPFDRFLVERAVYNLVNNAIPETPAGGEVAVRVWREYDQVFIEVRDTGRGMPAHVLDRILSGSAVSTKVGGTGLGTAIVKKVAEAHGGRLEGESVEGEGTTLRISLPR